MTKLISRVFDAARDGCNTSEDISEVLGMSTNMASAYVSQLVKQGLLKRTGSRATNKYGQLALMVFELAEEISGATLYEQGTASGNSQRLSGEWLRGGEAVGDQVWR